MTQVTHVVAGRLTVRMREPGGTDPYELVVESGAAVVTEPGTPVQFANDTDTDIHVLYVTSPAYVRVRAAGRTVYDDAVLLDDWSGALSDTDRARARARRATVLRRSRGG